jgi:hypothetical protein
MAIRLLGDALIAGRYVKWAKAKLVNVKRTMEIFHSTIAKRWYTFDDAIVSIDTVNGWDQILIIGISGGEILIISHVGTATYDFSNKRYYDKDGNDITLPDGKVPDGWTITDDGEYGITNPLIGFPDYDDPKQYTYSVQSTDPGSLQIPAVANGKAAISQIGSKATRILLNGSIEDELYLAFADTFGVTGWNFLQFSDSLVYSPYRYRSNKPWISRYVSDGLITASQKVQSQVYSNILVLQGLFSDDFFDSVNKVTRIYYEQFNDVKGKIRTYASINGGGCVSAITNFYSASKNLNQDLVRLYDKIDNQASTPSVPLYPGFYAPREPQSIEPAFNENYNILGNTSLSSGIISLRGVDLVLTVGGVDYYRTSFLDGEFHSGMKWDIVGSLYVPVDDGIESLQNDVKNIYDIREDGQLTYVRIQKDDHLGTCNTGIYCAGRLVEESGFQQVIKLYDNSAGTVWGPQIGFNGRPLYIRKSNYQILQTHHEPGWDVCLYRKTTYKSNSSQILDYYFPINGGTYVKPILTQIDSIVTYSIYINGTIYKIDPTKYYASVHEQQISYPDSPTYAYGSFPDSKGIYSGYTNPVPWFNVDAGSSNITRIFTSASKKHILVGFDIYPAIYSHDLILTANGGTVQNQALEATYNQVNSGNIPFIPSSDGSYAHPDRKWFLFDTGGGLITDLPTPTFIDPITKLKTKYSRVNSLCLLET